MAWKHAEAEYGSANVSCDGRWHAKIEWRSRFRARDDRTWGGGNSKWRQGQNRKIREFENWRQGQMELFFFYNFPDNWDAKALWHRFQECGKVGDVFVPAKRDKWGKSQGKPLELEVASFGEKVSGGMVGATREGIIDFSPSKEENKWLEGSIVTVVRSMSMISTIQERVDIDGGLINLSPLGGRSVLLTERLEGYLTWCDRCFERITESVGEVTLKLKVEKKLYEIMVTEEEWRVDPNWWLVEDDSHGDTTTGSEYCSSENGEEDPELMVSEIRGDDEANIDADLLQEKGILNLNNEEVTVATQWVREEENGPVTELGLMLDSNYGLKEGSGPDLCAIKMQEICGLGSNTDSVKQENSKNNVEITSNPQSVAGGSDVGAMCWKLIVVGWVYSQPKPGDSKRDAFTGGVRGYGEEERGE
ncbi:hypothetical protein SLEP1_g17156 [Rubroshorea leprosula]|uniref:Uncharacterized protein n=1 Tax=Rubroshorea leprosula TaxID=152421 RepID=A0AAV5J272_9ROSI|nr:hypothetical protein SLEP1_g17156 [Rubroshorea leprosula]